MKEFHIYKDIRQRTNGEIYLGVVGPVRTGKSTFIRRFMDEMVTHIWRMVRQKRALKMSFGRQHQARTLDNRA